MQSHREQHRTGNTGWLRAAVLGANDGLLSTASLLLGVAAAHGATRNILVAGVAGLLAGSMSMAAGEYVSVSSQADVEQADIERETAELSADPSGELEELADIYVTRGLDRKLATDVAAALMKHDALGSHMRDELGMSELTSARPVQAALSSASCFISGGVLPLAAATFSTSATSRGHLDRFFFGAGKLCHRHGQGQWCETGACRNPDDVLGHPRHGRHHPCRHALWRPQLRRSERVR